MTESTDKSSNSITVGDQPATEDALGFTPYVIAMAEFLTHPNTKAPLTISIEGEWGSGKSSFMKQLETQIKEKSKELEKEKLKEIWKEIKELNTLNICDFLQLKFGLKQKIQTVWFNAWRHDKSESLWATFALSFLEQISENRDLHDVIPNFWSHGRLLVSRLDLKKNWVKNVLGILQKFATFIFIGGIAVTIPYLYIRERNNLATFSKEIVCQLEKNEKNKDDKKDNEDKSTTENKSKTIENNSCSGKYDSTLNILLFLMGGGGSFSVTFVLLAKLRDLIGDSKLDLKEYLESPDYDSQVTFIEKFHEDFSKIVNAYAGKDEKVYVFIDDLDRCELGKSADLLQSLNLMISNDPNIIFILGMDREKVAAAITFKQKDVLPFLASTLTENQAQKTENDKLRKQLDYGFSFMEKFIQLSFSVPKPSQNTLNGFLKTISENKKETSPEKYFLGISHVLIIRFFDELKDEPPKEKTPNSQQIEDSSLNLGLDIFPIMEKDLTDENLADLIKMVAPFFDYNPRSLKQYINVVRLRTYIAYYAVGVTFEERGTITIEQIGKFIALTLKYPRLLLALQKDDQLLVTLEKLALANPELTNNANEWINNPQIKEILCYGKENEEKYSLQKVDIQKLLVVLPGKGTLSSKYFKLRDFLAAGKWKDADQETTKVMLQVANRVSEGYLNIEDIDNFPSKDLRTIDQLWVKYSNGKFGFSVQKKIYIDELGGTKKFNVKIWKEFSDRVGWMKGGNWLSYSDLTFELLDTTPVAHLPRLDVGVLRWASLAWVCLLSRKEL
ncbi:GUN4 domain-containing protein [Crocosphaera sp. XPORK-15E]|uniref:GUN4 domain-containing protein n=1 Tax=Crocosphaera sp. XPORK-15E TaxID=3110247 RepID=UPI002B1EA65D|nr:GUN4 domain-containing protein [Crocosphaera sp. XPORK-15E]MEA5535062.1 GUN4 domain-containing protein [Crocosphaera sp. XPORK-15E]